MAKRYLVKSAAAFGLLIKGICKQRCETVASVLPNPLPIFGIRLLETDDPCANVGDGCDWPFEVL